MLNKVIIMGRLVADPELKQTPAGVPVCSLRIACDRDFKPESGEREADFFDVVGWRGTAEFISKYFTKGRVMAVEGRLHSRKYTDRDGNKRTAIEIVADNVYFGNSKPAEKEAQRNHTPAGDSEDFPDFPPNFGDDE